jgi:CBS domain-containing protein
MRIMDRPEFGRKGSVMTFAASDMVSVAVKAMSAKNYGAAVIVDKQNKPIGIVTERDFMRRLLNKELDQKKTPISAIMTKDLRVAKAEDNLLDWLRMMSNDRFRHLPVVDDDGKLIDMMSQGDFVSYTWPELLSRVKEQARATFDVNPSIYTFIGVLILMMLAAMVGITAYR